MANRTIAIVDINSFHKQNIETLLFACILEKKIKRLSVLDLNYYEQDKLLPKKSLWTKQGEILTTTLFSNTSYQIVAQSVLEQNKLLNLAKVLKPISDILIINTNSQQYKFNSEFYKEADDIVIFADIEKDITNNIINFFLKHDLKNKKIHIVVNNYKSNVQVEKEYLQLLKQFRTPNISITNIDQVPNLKSISEIETIDPWMEIYKKINSTF